MYELGFKGRDHTFRRIRGELVDIVDVQQALHGASCTVALGMHLTFLPVVWASSKIVHPKKLRIDDCEFQKKLSPDNQPEHWWPFNGSGYGDSPESCVNDIVNVYNVHGEPGFQQFQHIEDVLQRLTLDNLDSDKEIEVFGLIVPVRGALIASRIYKHIGNFIRASDIAKVGINHLGHAVGFRNELEELAELRRV